jgi:Glycosyltransferase family 87
MAVAQGSPRRTAVRGRSWLPLVGYGGLVAVVAWWAWRAFHDPMPWDTGLAYTAGQVAWATGHPEHLASWISTPFLGAVMALLSRVLSVRGVADLVTGLNVVLWGGASVVVLKRTRPLLSPLCWWIAAFALLSFAPLMSSVWFKQFNVIALVLAVAGWELVRRGRVSWGAAAIGLSVSVKPLVILLPFVMLARRGTRRAGALAVVWVVGLNMAAQAFMAERAHDFATIDPLIPVRNFLDKTKPNLGLCLPLNFSPSSLLCRAAGGTQDWTLQRVIVVVGVLLFGMWVVDALRGRSATSWEVFAFTCPISVMLSVVAWTHYQIMLAPLFVLLFVRFAREGASIGCWAGLLTAFVLASLIWQPYGSVVSAVRGVFSPQPGHEPNFLEGIAEFSQYILVITGVLWYARRRLGGSGHVAEVESP